MACQIQTDKYTDVVLDLIKLDPTLYNNFDNAATFILKSGLTPEQKMQAVHNIAHIYMGLSELDPAFFVKGKVDQVISTMSVIDTPEDYVTSVSGYYDIRKPSALKEEAIMSKIEALDSKPGSLHRLDLKGQDGILDLIKNYFAVTRFENAEEQQASLDRLTVALRAAIVESTDTEEHKEFLLNIVSAELEGLSRTSDFIPLSQIADMANLKNFLVTLTSGQMVETIFEEGNHYVVQRDGSLEVVPASNIASAKEARMTDRFKGNAGEFVFTEDSLLSNFTIKGVIPDQTDTILQKLDEMPFPMSGIRISAMRIGEVAETRLNRIKQVAQNTPSLSSLERRNHETFETQAQVQYLQSTSKGKIVTLSRPSADNQVFVLVGEIIGTGEKFYMYANENLAFVNSDNSTESVDLTNPGHLAEIQKLSVKSTPAGRASMSSSDLETLRDSVQKYNAFKASVLPALQEEFDKGVTSVDITSQFSNHYEINQSKNRVKKKTLLSEEMESDPTLYQEVTVFNADTQTRELKRLPFIFNKRAGLFSTFELVDMLTSKEKIEVTNPDGMVSEFTHESYARDKMGLTNETVNNLLTARDKSQKNLMIRFRNDGTTTYKIVENTRQLDELEEFATFIVGISDILESTRDLSSQETRDIRDRQLFDFDMSQFTFQTAVTKRADGKNDRPFFIQFSTNKEGRLQLKIKPADKDGRYGFMESKGKDGKTRLNPQFKFVINERLITNIAKALRGQGPLVPKVKEKFPALAKFDLTKNEDLFAFYKALNNMTRETSVDPLVQQLVDQIEEAHTTLTESVIKDVVERFEEKTNMFPEFLKNLKEDFTYNGEFKPEYLVSTVSKNNKKILNVRYSPKYTPEEGVDAKERFRVETRNYKVVDSNQSRLSVVPRAASSPVITESAGITAEPQIIEPVAPTEKQHVVTNTAPTITPSLNDLEEIPLSAAGVGEDITTETPQDRATAARWATESLPQFQIDPNDVAEVLDLTKVDGTVLGAFKNKVIYLNNQVLSKGVVYHEAFHGVFRYLMTAEEREKAISEIRTNKNYSSRFTEAFLKEFASVRNYVYSKERMEALVAEEILAEGFQQYMIKKGPAPKGIIGRIAELIKKLIEFFTKNGDYIDNVYGRIRKGGYRNVAVATSDIFENEVAYEIPGLKKIVPAANEAGVGQRLSTISSSEQDQLVNMVTYIMLTDTVKGEDFAQKFDRAAKILLDSVYNVDRLVQKNPAKKDEIVKAYGELYAQYRFMLGARMLGEQVSDINLSGRPQYDNAVVSNIVSKSGEKLNNIDGSVSKKILMDLVLQNYNRAKTILEGGSFEETTFTPKAVEESFTEDGVPVVNNNDPDGANSEETDNSNDFDDALYMHNRLESMSKEIRNLLALTYYEKQDKKLGISVPRMINGEQMFSLLLQISANIDSENIISHIKTSAETMRMDGFEEAAEDLEQVYENIKRRTGMDSEGVPRKNMQLYNMLIDALEGTESDFLMTNVRSTENTESDPETGLDIKIFNTFGYTIKDQILYKDVDNVKKGIVASIITTHAEKGNTEQYVADVQKLIGLTKQMSSSFILSSENQGIRLNTLTEDMHKALQAVGITFPKSLIRMSILAIDKQVNKAILKESDFEKTVLDHYDAHSNFIGEKKYLEQDFFKDLEVIFTKAASLSHNKFASLLDDKNTKDLNINRFNTILGKAASYVVKYDPSVRQSTVRNAEGKPIYRYIKYTPALIVAQSLRSKGLKATLESDPYFKSHLEAFIKDNPALGKLIEETGELSLKDKQVALMLKNFRIGIYGGVSQEINQKFVSGKSFKNIDSKSMYILNILSTMNRTTVSETVTDKDGKSTTVELETYMRSFSQLEASQTNFLMSAIYEKFADKTGLVKGSAKRLKIVDTLEQVVNQEYNRIARELDRVVAEKTKFDNGQKNDLVLKYNALHKKGDPTKADVTSEQLRAFKFNKLADFFNKNPEAYTSLRDQIASGVTFDKIPADVKNTLLDQLNVYAQQQFQKHLDQMVELEALKVTTETPAGTTNPLKIYTSNLIPTTLRKDGRTSDVMDEYQYVNGKPSLEGLVADSYFNFWANSLTFNDILDGDVAMNVKDATDYFKRQKKFLAAGSTLKKGTHKVAYINTLQGYVNEKYPQYGPFYSVEEMNEYFENHPGIDSEIVETITKEYGAKGTMRDTFDGQSFSSILHQIDMHEATGRLSPEIFELLIAKHYRALTREEVTLMENNKVVNNPKKTVTAARNSYHKLSESIIDRNDVSQVIMPENIRDIADDARREQAFKKYKESLHPVLHALYADIYALRQKIKDAVEIGEDPAEFQEAITRNVEKIHEYYTPLKNREKLHDLLNAMEYHQVDQLIDTTASKNATLLPVDYFAEKANLSATKKYINLPMSTIEVDNKYKFLQVETSGVKDTAKFSVQAKALIAADILNLADIAAASRKEVSDSDKEAIKDAATALVNFQKSLKEVGESNLVNLKTIIRKGGDFELGKVFSLIRSSLLEQGAPESTLKLFEVDETGKPLFSSNLPGIRNMLEFYFFAQYSKHITDEKGSGGKNIHISGFGYDVLEDEDGNIVTTEQYQKDPSRYPNVKSRPLGVETKVIDGKTVHFVEAIVPLPYFRNQEHKDFYIANLTKMFATRIPTEDKRSMIALKIVDFIDGSNLNGVIVPQMVHMLSGSDFDVDALYSQTYAHYFNASGKPSIYGNYSNYRTEEEGKFVEFVTYMSSDKDISAQIKLEKQILKEKGKDFSVTETTYNFLQMSGITDEDFDNAVNISIINDENLYEQEQRFEKNNERKELKQKYVAAKLYSEANPEDRAARQERYRLGKLLAVVKTDLAATDEEILDLKTKVGSGRNFIKQVLQAEATFRVFEKNGLPVDFANFVKKPELATAVRPVFQNKNLTAKLEIMSNDAVFKYLYINERSSVERFEQILEAYGIKLEDFDGLFNPYTVDGVVFTKKVTSMNKDGIGITANLNKFLSLASQFGLKIKDEHQIWKFKTGTKNAEGDFVLTSEAYTNFGTLNKEKQRAIALIGNILGMFADGAKKPIPAALYMNEVNAGVTLGMVGLGLSPEFAFGFNFMTEIRKAVESVQSSKYALNESTQNNDFVTLGSEVRSQLQQLIKEQPADYEFLKTAGLFTDKSTPFKTALDNKNLVINFAAQKLDSNLLQTNALTTTDIGYSVSVTVQKGDVDPTTGSTAIENTVIPLTETQQRMVLLHMYAAQAEQMFAVQRAGSVVNMFKALNPRFVTFDKMMKSMNEMLDEKSIFESDGVNRIFSDDQVFKYLREALVDLDEQSSKLFLERSPAFASVRNLFESVFTDHSLIAKISTSFVGLRKYVLNSDNQDLKDVFAAEHWFTNTLNEELKEMQEKYPENKFLQLLRVEGTENFALDASGKAVKERVLKMINNSKLSGDYAKEVNNDAQMLYYEENKFYKKLFYNELARTALLPKTGSFIQLFDPELQKNISKNIEDFIKVLKEKENNAESLEKGMRAYMGNDSSVADMHQFFNELFIQLANGATTEAGNKKIKSAKNISFSKETLLVKSFNFAEGVSETEIKATVAQAVEKVAGSLFETIGKNLVPRSASKDKTVKQNFTLDFRVDSKNKISERFLSAMGSKLNVLPSSEVKGAYTFPLIIRVDGQSYMLQGVDENITAGGLGEAIIESIAVNDVFVNEGLVAQYALIPRELSSGTFSPIGFTKETSEKYMSLVKRTSKLGATESNTVDEAPLQSSIIKSVEINSNSKGLAAALTNPTELAKSKGNLAQSYPIYFQWLNNEGEAQDANFKDVEEAFQKLKNSSEAKTKPSKESSDNYKLMVDLITEKLKQYPRLVSQVTKQGGSAWILSSTHQPTKQNTVWETGGQNWFIQALNDAYVKVTQPVSQNLSQPPVETEEIEEPDFGGSKDSTSLLLQLMQSAKVQETVTEPVNSIQPGQFVKFNNQTFIVTKLNSNGTIQVYNPTLEGTAAKKSVAPANIEVVNGKAEIVTYKKASYMVTPKNTIISLTTNKAMQWDESNGDRREVIAMAEKSRALNTNLQNLNLTEDVLDTLYGQSSKRMSKAEFSKAAFDIVSNLKASRTNQEIIEKIKCL